MKRFILFTLVAITLATPCFASVDSNHSYSDVTSETDYKEEIDFASKMGIFKGNDDGTFTPTKPLNRAEMAMLLMRLEFLEEETFHLLLSQLECVKKTYPDVKENSWYSMAVYRAQCTGLMIGDEAGTFRPEDSLTASEVLTIFYRAYNKYAENISGETWYLPGLNWAEKTKITPPTFKGLGYKVTRAEMARLFEKLYQYHKGYEISENEYLTAQELIDGLPETQLITPVSNPYALEKGGQLALNTLKEWSDNGSVLATMIQAHPLPWSLKEEWGNGVHRVELHDANNTLIVTNQSESDLLLFNKSLLQHYRQSIGGNENYLKPSEWKYFDQGIATIPNAYAWSEVNISQSGQWVTLPYRSGYVGALNLETGAFALHHISNDQYSQVLADDQGVLYTENNAWGCMSNDALSKVSLQLTVKNQPCHIVYESAKGQKTTFEQTVEPFLDGLYSYQLRMNKGYAFVFDSIWECYYFCPPRIAIYNRLDDGSIQHRESWNYGPNNDNTYVENPKYYTFGHYTEEEGWILYDVPAIEPVEMEVVDWEAFWASHPELTDPNTLLKS